MDDPAAEPPAWVARGREALLGCVAEVDEAEPLRVALLRAAGALGTEQQIEPLLAFWERRTPGNPRSATRYRWELTHRVGVRLPSYAPKERDWTAWRLGEQAGLAQDPFTVEERMMVPIVTVANLDLLLELSRRQDHLGDRARQLADEAAAIARRDFARYVATNDPWEDTFALWCVSRMPRTLDLLHPLVLAALTSYAAGHDGPVHGNRFPYYDKPLVTASAQLATALLAMGADLPLAAELAKFVGAQRRASGGWGDDPDREDPLTSLVAADLLARTDPSFDPSPTLGYFADTQGQDGLWRALGPEAPWLTSEILAFATAALQPSFAARFRWPHRARSTLDHKTGIPFFEYFSDLAAMFSTLPGLAASRVQLAFIDLIGFRAFNNRHGQDAGDEVLRLFATHLLTIPATRAIRDGGDEFLVVAAPERAGMDEDLRAFMTSWRARFRIAFGADTEPVAPRIVLAPTSGASLRQLRQDLGRRITTLKELESVGPEGILVTVGA